MPNLVADLLDTEPFEEKPTLVFEDNSYVIEDLSEKAQYLVGQLQDLAQQANATRGRLDQIEVARTGFTEMLREELVAKSDEVAE